MSENDIIRDEHGRLWAELGDCLAEEKHLYEVRDPEMPQDNELVAVLQKIDQLVKRIMLLEELLLL